MKTIILYYSSHHGNTKKLVDAIAAAGVETLDVKNAPAKDLSEYDLIGLASGIYAGNFGKPLLNYAEANLPAAKHVFFLYSYAKKMGHYTNSIRKIVESKQCRVIGEYSCQGYNTFGPFKLVGGTAKGHPTKEECDGAVKFFEELEIK